MPPNRRIYYEQKEITIDFMSNSLGMRNAEIIENKPDSVFRIICLGDSYTEGDGSTWGYSYPRQLQDLLNAGSHDLHFEVINAGKNGSDIIYCESILRGILHNFDPDLILLAINDSDIDDIIQRGGTERFRQNNTTVFRKGPWYEGIYQRSHAFRFIIHVPLLKNKLFLGPIAAKRKKNEAAEIIGQSMTSINRFADDRDFTIRYVIHPLAWHMSSKRNRNLKKSDRDYQSVFNKTSTLSHTVLDRPAVVYNLYPSLTEKLMNNEYQNYAWPLNGHFNRYGYSVFAEEVYGHLMKDPELNLH